MTTHRGLGQLPAKLFTPHGYMQLLGVVGMVALGWSLLQLDWSNSLVQFAGLLLLGALAAITSARQAVNDTSIKYETGSAVAIAALPFFGIAGGIIIGALSHLTSSIHLYYAGKFESDTWMKWRVNVGMHAISITAAGWAWWLFEQRLPTWLIALAWFAIALLYDQINFLTMTSALRLLQGPKFSVVRFWMDKRWAMAINIAITAIGGGLLSEAISAYDWRGILIFFLPIVLSMFSTHTIVRHYQKTMDELEGVVTERTHELKTANAELAGKNVQLLTLNEELTRANAANSRFLAVLSHDMRSPLTGIKLYGQLLQRRPDMPPEKRIHMMQVILQNTQTLVELVDNLVEIEQSGNDALAMQLETIDLNSLMHEVAFNFEAHAVEKQIAIDVQLAPEPVVISADRQLIKRSITNLVSNAIKYTPNNGKVSLSVRREDNEANVRVADTGIGIPDGEIDKIFESYHRVDEHRAKAQGLGLGLSIVKRYIELHDGEIFVTSTVGEGSQFNVYLPIKKPNAPDGAEDSVAT